MTDNKKKCKKKNVPLLLISYHIPFDHYHDLKKSGLMGEISENYLVGYFTFLNNFVNKCFHPNVEIALY